MTGHLTPWPNNMELLRKLDQCKRLGKWEIRPVDAWLFVCLVLISAYLLSSLFVSVYQYFSQTALELDSLPIIIASGLGFQLSSVAAWYCFKRFVPYEPNNHPDSTFRAIKIGTIGFIAAYLILLPTVLIWRLALESLNFEYEFQLPVLLIQNGGTPLEMAMMALLVVIVAPICEELVYRGFLFRYLNERLPIGLAIAIPSALFALMHVNLYSFAPLFILGAILSIVYKISGNLISSITLHGLFNLVNLLMIYFIEPIEI